MLHRHHRRCRRRRHHDDDHHHPAINRSIYQTFLLANKPEKNNVSLFVTSPIDVLGKVI